MVIVLRISLLLLVAFVLFAVWIYFRQDSMIYHPRPYRDDHLAMVPQRAVKLEYKISCGRQTMWYVPPKQPAAAGELPQRLWILFGGNGSLALFWSELVAQSPDDQAGYLMFEYPGYGHCHGKPSPDTMAESGDAAVVALAQYLDSSADDLKKIKIRLLGHSLGAGVALAFAQRHEVDRVVLAAPFTSTRAMANRAVSPWLGWLLRHNFDNMAALATLAKRDPQPQVIVTHGDADHVIPVEMARQMKSQWPDLVEYVEVPGANHESILDQVERYMASELPRQVTLTAGNSLVPADEAENTVSVGSSRGK